MNNTAVSPIKTEVVDLCLAKVNLSVPLMATFYNQGLNDTQIAKRTGRSQQGVSSYKLKHIEEITPLILNRQMYNEMQSAHVAQQYRKRLIDINNAGEAFTKKDIISCVAAADRMTQQERLYGDRSTSNIAVEQVHIERDEIAKRRAMLQQQLDAM